MIKEFTFCDTPRGTMTIVRGYKDIEEVNDVSLNVELRRQVEGAQVAVKRACALEWLRRHPRNPMSPDWASGAHLLAQRVVAGEVNPHLPY